MGLIFVPIFLLLLSFLVPGIWLARKAIAAATDKRYELKYLFVLTGLLGATEIAAPFLIARAIGESVGAFAFLLCVCLSALIPAITIGLAFGIVFKAKAISRYGIVGAAIFISTGLLPFSWFLLADLLRTVSGLKFGY